MVHKTLLGCVLLLLFMSVQGTFGDESELNMTGVLGESVTFQLKFSEPPRRIAFLRSKGDVGNVAVLDPGDPCALDIWHTEYKGRLNASNDCKRLQLNNLKQDDSGTYKAERPHEQGLQIFFNLWVYKRLSESDLRIQCGKIKNGTYRLNCSAGNWEDGVKFSLASGNNKENPGRSLDIPCDLEESNPNISCTAQNPVSKASRIQPLKDICADHPAMTSTAGPESPNAQGASLGIVIPLVIAGVVIAVILVGILCWQKKKKGAIKKQPGPAEAEGYKTIYARVGDVVEDTENIQPRTEPRKEKAKTPQTLYITVDHHNKRNPLQTDDEKMQKGRRGAPEQCEKTIYSEITKPEEGEDESLKTVYETVKNPHLPKEHGYNKII